MPLALSVRGLRKAYGSVQALRGVDLHVAEGELFGLLGPNGAGKSTLVKIACGLVRPTGGDVAVCGHAAGSAEAHARLGYLAELFRFPDWCTADEVLGLHQDLTGSSGGAPERRELLELVELADVAGRRVGAMSKGMQQRLGLAQALDRRAPPAAARRADERARSGRAAHRPRPAGRAARARGRRPAQLPSPVGDRARLRPRRDHRRRVRGRRGQPRRAQPRRRRGGGDERGPAPLPARAPRRRAADRARAGRRGRGRLRRARADLDARGRLPGGGRPRRRRGGAACRSRRRSRPRAPRAGGAARRPVQPARVAAPAGLRRRRPPHARLPRALRPGGVAGVRDVRRAQRPVHRRRGRRHRGRRDAGRARDVRDPVPRGHPGRLPHARCRPRGRRARLHPAAARPAARAPHAAARALARGDGGVRALRGRGHARRVRAHGGLRRLVAGPRRHAAGGARPRGGDHRRAVARGLDRASPRRPTGSPSSCSSAPA